VDKEYSHFLVRFILPPQGNVIVKLLVHPFSNALKKGAQLDKENLSFIKKLCWASPFFVALLLGIYIEEPDIITLVLTLNSLMCTAAFLVVLLGYRYRDEIDTGAVVAFDKNTAKSGGVWGVVGLSIWAAYKAYFGL
jgi:hypothetical protein